MSNRLESEFSDYSSAGKNVTKILDDILSGYDKRLRPNYGGPAVNVGITSKKTFKFTMYGLARNFKTARRCK